MIDDATDDWGLTDAEHTELQRLLTRHHEAVYGLLGKLHRDAGLKPNPSELGTMGRRTWMLTGQADTRLSPWATSWRLLLDRLRELDHAGHGTT